MEKTTIRVDLWDWDFGFSHDEIGYVEIPGSTLKSKVKMNEEVEFKEKIQEPGKGFLLFSLKLSDSSQDNLKELKKKASIKRESKRNQIETNPEILHQKLVDLEKKKNEEVEDLHSKIIKELNAKKKLNEELEQEKKKGTDRVEDLKKEYDEKIKDLEEKLTKKEKEMENVMIESSNDVKQKQEQLDDMKKKYKEMEDKLEAEKTSKHENLGEEIKNLKESFQIKFDNELKSSKMKLKI